jgi:hypothetical protein
MILPGCSAKKPRPIPFAHCQVRAEDAKYQRVRAPLQPTRPQNVVRRIVQFLDFPLVQVPNCQPFIYIFCCHGDVNPGYLQLRPLGRDLHTDYARRGSFFGRPGRGTSFLPNRRPALLEGVSSSLWRVMIFSCSYRVVLLFAHNSQFIVLMHWIDVRIISRPMV